MEVYERFLKYVTFGTQSDEESESCPSTPGQLILADLLKAELEEIGARDVSRDENGYVYATVPAAPGCEEAPVLAFLAHMDTASEASGENVNPRIIRNYNGKDILLREGVVTRVSDFPALADYAGQDLIVTDGTTLLGADDKAGIAEIMQAAERLIKEPGLPHPELRIVFTPDEEIGRGPDRINMAKVSAAYGFTADGGPAGEVEYENFNAASARVTVHGVAVHPGAAYHVMKNAALIAAEFTSLLPEKEIPSETQNREGFFHLLSMEGDVSRAELRYILRDHDYALLLGRMTAMEQAAKTLNEKYGEGTVELEQQESYRNMVEMILPENRCLIDAAKAAIEKQGLTVSEEPIRGGTDGARLSFMGLPCPNLGTGCHACHGLHEFVPIPQMEAAVGILLEIAAQLSK